MTQSNIDLLASLVAIRYQNRGSQQHYILTQLLNDFFPTLSAQLCKMFTFYLRCLQGPTTISSLKKQFNNQSFVFTGLSSSNPEKVVQMASLTKQSKIVVSQGDKCIYLDYLNYLNILALGDSTIQQQIDFMRSSEFLCSLPKSKLYHLLRYAKISTYCFSEQVYFEGQQVISGQSGSGVYFVRKGEFGYYKNSQKQGKQIQTLRFSKGHIFGTLQLNSQQLNKNRKFTVKCKSNEAIVYNFSEELFMTCIEPYCLQYLNKRQKKLMKYLDHRVDLVSHIRNQKLNLLSQTLTRRFSQNEALSKDFTKQLPIVARTKISMPIGPYSSRERESQRIQQQGLRKTSYLSINKQGPMKKYPLPLKRSMHMESEFRQLTRLHKSKEKCEKIKNLTSQKCSSGRGQILFQFFKKSWAFDHQKKPRNRYNNLDGNQ